MARTIKIGTCGHPVSYTGKQVKVCLACYKSGRKAKLKVGVKEGRGRPPLLLTAEGETKTITEWAALLNCSIARIRYYMRGIIPFETVYRYIKDNPERRFSKIRRFKYAQ
jgi:hypothetical protein